MKQVLVVAGAILINMPVIAGGNSSKVATGVFILHQITNSTGDDYTFVSGNIEPEVHTVKHATIQKINCVMLDKNNNIKKKLVRLIPNANASKDLIIERNLILSDYKLTLSQAAQLLPYTEPIPDIEAKISFARNYRIDLIITEKYDVQMEVSEIK